MRRQSTMIIKSINQRKGKKNTKNRPIVCKQDRSLVDVFRLNEDDRDTVKGNDVQTAM